MRFSTRRYANAFPQGRYANNTCRVLGEKGRGKGKEKTLNPYPLTLSQNQTLSSKCKTRVVLGTQRIRYELMKCCTK
jgi:hypothetical protein